MTGHTPNTAQTKVPQIQTKLSDAPVQYGVTTDTCVEGLRATDFISHSARTCWRQAIVGKRLHTNGATGHVSNKI